MPFAQCLWKPINGTGVVFLVDFGFAKRVLWRLCKVPRKKMEVSGGGAAGGGRMGGGVLYLYVCVCIVYSTTYVKISPS